MKWLVALLLLSGPAMAGKRVPDVQITDPRLSSDSRQLLADAEDELAIADAATEDAQATLEREQAWRDELGRRLNGQDDELRKRFSDLGTARVKAARLAVDATRARRGLAQARLMLTRADTVLRHDLAVVELEPLQRSVDQERERVAQADRALAEAQLGAESVADQVWARWRALRQQGAPPLALFIP